MMTVSHLRHDDAIQIQPTNQPATYVEDEAREVYCAGSLSVAAIYAKTYNRMITLLYMRFFCCCSGIVTMYVVHVVLRC